MPRLLKARALLPGGTVGLAAPAGPIDPEKLAAGEACWRDAGFRVVRRDDLVARRGYLAGDDTRRAREIDALVRDPDVDAIVCVRGGYGCDRILESLDPAAFRAARKPLVGYSDVTALLLWQRRLAGLVGFHGPMLDRGEAQDAEVFGDLVAQLEGRTALPLTLRGRGTLGGTADGRLVGGNLVLVTASLGTRWEIDTRGAILLLEEVGEPPYRIDRMLRQLHHAGKLAPLAGIGLGAFDHCVDERHPEPGVHDVAFEALGPLGIPIVRDLPFGHIAHNRAWPLGARATIDGDRGEIRILEAGVTRNT